MPLHKADTSGTFVPPILYIPFAVASFTLVIAAWQQWLISPTIKASSPNVKKQEQYQRVYNNRVVHVILASIDFAYIWVILANVNSGI